VTERPFRRNITFSSKKFYYFHVGN